MWIQVIMTVPECVTYWLCMIQRVLMKPFLDHLNCNRDKLEWITKQQWAVSLKGQTDNYWFLPIICLISLSELADSAGSPSRLICPNISLWHMRTPHFPHLPTRSCIHTHIRPEILWEFFFLHSGNLVQRAHILVLLLHCLKILNCETERQTEGGDM